MNESMPTLKERIQETLQNLAMLAPQTDTDSIEMKAYKAYVVSVKEQLSALSELNESELPSQLEAFFTKNWELVKGSFLCYTAIPNDMVTKALIGLADTLCEESNRLLEDNDAPKTSLELLMPGLSLVSFSDDYPSFEVIKHPGKLSDNEKRNLATLSSAVNNRTLLKPQLLDDDSQKLGNAFFVLTHPIREPPTVANMLAKLNKGSDNAFIGREDEIRNYLDWQQYMLLKTKQEKIMQYEKLQKDTAHYETHGDFLVPRIDVSKVFNTHILSHDQKSLIPVLVLINAHKDMRPYIDMDTDVSALAQEEERNRLINHSSETSAYESARANLALILSDQSNLLGHLNVLCSNLKHYDAHAGIGHNERAGEGVYAAIIEFNTYYQSLCDAEKEKIPSTLKTEIDLLLSLSSNPEQNDNATQNLSTCIGTRREHLEAAIKGNEVLLASIANQGDAKTTLIETAQKELLERKASLFAFYETPQHLDPVTTDDKAPSMKKKDKLSINKKILEALKIDTTIRSLTDFNTIMCLENQDILALFKNEKSRKEIVDVLRNVETLHDVCLDLPLNKIKALCTITNPTLFETLLTQEQNIQQVLFALSEDKVAYILQELVQAKKVEFIFIAQHYPESLQSILENLSEEERLAVITTKDKNDNTILHAAAQHPKLLTTILVSLPETQRFDAVMAKNRWNNNTVGLASYQHLESLQAILGLLPKDKLLAVVTAKATNGNTILHEAIKHPESFKTILDLLPKDTLLAAVKVKDKYGQTVLFAASQYPESIKMILNLYPKAERLAVITTQNHKDFLQTASTNPQSLITILSLLPEDERLEVVQKYNKHGKTLLQVAYKDLESLQAILKLLPEEARFLAVKESDADRKTILSSVCQDPKALKMILDLYPEGELLAAIKTKDIDGNTVLDAASQHPESFKMILDLYPTMEERLDAVARKSNNGRPILDWAAQDPPLLKMILAIFPKEALFTAVKESNVRGNTLLHTASQYPESLKMILDLYPEGERRAAVLARDIRGKTVFAASDYSATLLKTILESLPEKDRFGVVNTTDKHGNIRLHPSDQEFTTILSLLPEDKRIEVLLIHGDPGASMLNQCIRNDCLQSIIDSLPKSDPTYPPELYKALLLKLNELSMNDSPSAVQSADLQQQIACLTKIFQGKRLDDADMSSLKTDPAIKEILETHLSQEVTSNQKDWRGEIKTLREGEQPSPPIEPPKI